MAIWQRAAFDDGDGFNAQVNIDTGGDLWARVLSPSFLTDGGEDPDFTFVGHGCQLITSEPQE